MIDPDNLMVLRSINCHNSVVGIQIVGVGGLVIVTKNTILFYDLPSESTRPIWESNFSTIFTSMTCSFNNHENYSLIITGSIDGKISVINSKK